VRGGVGVVTYSLGNVPLAQKNGTTMRFLHANDLGSINVVTDAAGNLTKRVIHGAYGEIIRSTSADFVSIDYTGEKRDSTGLMYLHARYYDPSIGRFLSADTVVPEFSSTGFNRYAYAGNDPINNTDRNGNNWLGDMWGGMWNGFLNWAGFDSGWSAFGSLGGGADSLLNLRGISWGGAVQLGFSQALADGKSAANWTGGSGGPIGFGSAAGQAAWTTADVMSWASLGGAVKGMGLGVLGMLGTMGRSQLPQEALNAFRLVKDVHPPKELYCGAGGCDVRAKIWGNILARAGYDVRQVTVISTNPWTNFVPAPKNSLWVFHTAPAIRVEGRFFAIDPNFNPAGPLAVREWAARAGGSPVITERWVTGRVPWTGHYGPPDLISPYLQ
jgi:RHS repeat-associated protein